MLKSMVASKTARLIATCVCPVAGTVGITMGVPQVRSAVHKATAPRAYALPKTRAPESVAPLAAAAAPCLDLPTALSNGLLSPTGLGPSSVGGGALGTPPLFGGGGGGGGGIVTSPPTSPVPEPATWAQLLLGFGLIGGIARMTLRPVDAKRREEAGEVEAKG